MPASKLLTFDGLSNCRIGLNFFDQTECEDMLAIITLKSCRTSLVPKTEVNQFGIENLTRSKKLERRSIPEPRHTTINWKNSSKVEQDKNHANTGKKTRQETFQNTDDNCKNRSNTVETAVDQAIDKAHAALLNLKF